MNEAKSNMQLVSKLLFRLLPAQFFLAVIGSINSIISGLFASNCIGVDAMSATGLYSPFNMFINAISLMLVGGATILCGKYIGKNDPGSVSNVFFLDTLISILISALFISSFLILGIFDLTGFLTDNPTVRPLFNEYLVGQAMGVLPLILGTQLASFLALENKMKRTTIASIAYIIVNVGLNYVFIIRLKMGAFGLALASSIGSWVFMIIQAQYFFTKNTTLRFFKGFKSWKDSISIVKIGLPGAASNAYQTIRGFIVNSLVLAFVGSVGISAFAASDTLLRIGWAMPTAMTAVSRLMISISIGEEDRRTLVDVTRNLFRRFLPIMCIISLAVVICAEPLTMLYYTDRSQPVFMMTVWGFRLLALSLPFGTIYAHFSCYGQASGKQLYVNILAALDGVICVAGFTALLIGQIGMNSVYIANVLNGVVVTIIIMLVYPIFKNKRFPKNVEDMMVIDESFGVPEDERMDLTVRSTEEVVTISKSVTKFCLDKGIDKGRANRAGLFLEEMAGNVVAHGFNMDKKKHSIDVRVVHKNDDIILRIKDDCIPFNPNERANMVTLEDAAKNIGIRMIYKITDRIEYQNILGLNVLTITI